MFGLMDYSNPSRLLGPDLMSFFHQHPQMTCRRPIPQSKPLEPVSYQSLEPMIESFREHIPPGLASNPCAPLMLWADGDTGESGFWEKQRLSYNLFDYQHTNDCLQSIENLAGLPLGLTAFPGALNISPCIPFIKRDRRWCVFKHTISI